MTFISGEIHIYSILFCIFATFAVKLKLASTTAQNKTVRSQTHQKTTKTLNLLTQLFGTINASESQNLFLYNTKDKINLPIRTQYLFTQNDAIDYNLEIIRVVFKMDTLLLDTLIESNYLCMLLKRVFISFFNQKHCIALTPKRLVLILSRRFDRESTIVNTRQ